MNPNLRVLSASAVNHPLTRKPASPEIGDFGEIRWRNFDIRAGGVLAHLRSVARPGNHDADRRVSETESQGCLSERLHRAMDQKTKLVGFGQFLRERLALERSSPNIFALKSFFVGAGKLAG